MASISINSKSFVDISLSFTPNPINGDIPLLKDERAINNALKNCVMIAVKEVPFNRNMGSIVGQLLFEPADSITADDLQNEIERTIKFNEPRVKLQDVIVTLIEESYTYDVKIQYKIVGYDTIYVFNTILTPTSI